MTKLSTRARTTAYPSSGTPKIRNALATMNVRDTVGIAMTNSMMDTLENDVLAKDTNTCECIDLEALATMNVRIDEGVIETYVRKDTYEKNELATDLTNCECIDRDSDTKEMSAMHTAQRSTPDTRMNEYKNLTSHKPTELR